MSGVKDKTNTGSIVAMSRLIWEGMKKVGYLDAMMNNSCARSVRLSANYIGEEKQTVIDIKSFKAPDEAGSVTII